MRDRTALGTDLAEANERNRTMRPERRRPCRVAALAVILISLATPALAHGGEDLTAAEALRAWSFDPLLVGLTTLAAIIYFRGALRRRRTGRPIGRWRHTAFAAGLALVALALLSPLDAVAERLFWVHQIQHMLLRIAGPMLIMLAAPQAAMFAGAPRMLRRGLVRPLLHSRTCRSIVGWLARPAPAFLVFVGSLYAWQVPALHNAAILDPAVHYLMHVTMLAAGVLFFWVIFDPRDPPKGIRYGIRQLMLIGTILSNILLGSLTTLKSVVLYDAYDLHGRLFDFAPLSDEKAGGFLIWQPMSMMSLIALLIVFNGWNRFEERRWARRGRWTASNSAALEFPQTANELRMLVRPVNRRIGLGLAMLPLTVFALVITTAVTVLALGSGAPAPIAGDIRASAPGGSGTGLAGATEARIPTAHLHIPSQPAPDSVIR